MTKQRKKADEFEDEGEGPSLVEQIVENGEEVFSHSWDSGGPGAGAGCESVYKWKGKYATGSLDNDQLGPFTSLRKALKTPEASLTQVSDATTDISCSELSAAQLVKLLECYQDGLEVLVNDEVWVYRAGAWQFERKRDALEEPEDA
jgi:hypothetical protein